jgi:hypothetical protein
MKQPLIILFIAALFTGCKTDIEINAPYRNIHVVYGLLNQAERIQYIKVNKAFLGAGDALVYAQIPDSSELGESEVTHMVVNRYNANGQLTATFPVGSTMITNREPGVFYAPDQRMFYFTETDSFPLTGNQYAYLDQNSEYEIEMVVRGQELRARTNVVNDLLIGTNSPLAGNEMTLYLSTQGYRPLEVRFQQARDGKRYQLQYRFKYIQVRGEEAVYKEVVRTVGSAVAPNPQASGSLTITLPGEEFYRSIAAAVPVDATVTRRIFTGIDFIFTIANDEFHTYLTLSEPVSGIVQDRVEYSNVENGYGIFGSRYSKEFSRFLNGSSLTELMTGPYTGDRGFCYQLGNNAVQCP